MSDTTFREPSEDLPQHLCPLFVMAAYVYMPVEDKSAFAQGFARLTNALIQAGTKGEITIFHPQTLLPYDAHNAGFENEPSPVTADWVARINDVIVWFSEKDIEAAGPLLVTLIEHATIQSPMPINRRQAMIDALERNGGNKTKTADEFGVSRQRLSQIINQTSKVVGERKPLALVAQDPFGIARKAK